jgi:hypothetical protein
VRKAKVDDITMSEFDITMIDTMSDDDGGLESSSAELAPLDEVRPKEETTIDVSGEDAELRVGALVASSTPRAYQLEMLEESLRRNIIVAVSVVPHEEYASVSLTLTCRQMDTGSGKTHIVS